MDPMGYMLYISISIYIYTNIWYMITSQYPHRSIPTTIILSPVYVINAFIPLYFHIVMIHIYIHRYRHIYIYSIEYHIPSVSPLHAKNIMSSIRSPRFIHMDIAIRIFFRDIPQDRRNLASAPLGELRRERFRGRIFAPGWWWPMGSIRAGYIIQLPEQCLNL